MGGFFKLIEQYSTQDEPAFCGLASLAMVLNALSIDPRRTWKGSWRWFHEKLLDCCLPLDVVEREGVVLHQVACLARCNGAQVEQQHYGGFSLEEFRQAVAEVTTSGAEHLVVSYSRKAFLQTGDGHFSPVGGYHSGRDLVLILDTARFKYPPHWVPLPLLYEAMAALDPVTQQARGYLRLAAQPLQDSVLFSLDIRSSCWQPAHQLISSSALNLLQELVQSRPDVSPEEAVRQLVRSIPLSSLEAFIVQRVPAPSQPTSPTPPADAPAAAPAPPAPTTTSLPTAPPAPAAPSNGHTRTNTHTASCCPTHSTYMISATPSATALQPSPHPKAPIPTHLQPSVPPDLHATQPAHCAPASPTKGDTRCIPLGAQQQLLHEIRCLPLYQVVSEEVEALPQRPSTQYLVEKVCLLLLLQPPSAWALAWGQAPDDQQQQQQQFQQLLDATAVSIVEAEAAYLREQLAHIDEVLQYGSAHSSCAQPLDCATLGCPAASQYK